MADDVSGTPIVDVLRQNGLDALRVAKGRDVLQSYTDFRPDLIMLNVRLPDMPGLEVCRHLERFSNTPVLFLAESLDEETMIQCYESGGVDYLAKPILPRMLLARVRLALRMNTSIANGTYADSYLTIDLARQKVLVNGSPVALTMKEHALLNILMQRAPLVCTIEEILVNVWGETHRDARSHVYTYIRRLRKKLERKPHKPEYVITVHDAGYLFWTK